jgi:RNA polymerase sigma-70 factor (ECF subfamily)
MVMGVCRQILRRSHDAEDAFQATFLVLARKAGGIRVRGSLAPWLHRVAYRTAHRARMVGARYRVGEVELGELVGRESAPFELSPLLHDELSRLPGKYRDPIVLCHLEGKSHEEAARLLRWPLGTVSGRLSRGRQLLKARLERRGVVGAGVVLARDWGLGGSAVLPGALVESTLSLAIGGGGVSAVSTSVLLLAEGVVRVMSIEKLVAIPVVLALVATVSGVGVWGYQAGTPADAAARAGGPLAPVADQAVNPPPAAAKVASARLGRRKNDVNLLEDGETMPVKDTGGILLVTSADRKSLQALSMANNQREWQAFAIPPGVTVAPVAQGNVIALGFKGKTIHQLAVFSGRLGMWVKQDLLKPVEERISPVVGMDGHVLYQAGNDFYAFSARNSMWGVLHLTGEGEAKAAVSQGSIYVMQGKLLYVFNLNLGMWSKGVECDRGVSTRGAPGQ